MLDMSLFSVTYGGALLLIDEMPALEKRKATAYSTISAELFLNLRYCFLSYPLKPLSRTCTFGTCLL